MSPKDTRTVRSEEMRIRLTKCPLNPARIVARVDFMLPRPARTCHKCDTRKLAVICGIRQK
ncbi:unnamed protein product [Prunus armeniaca]